MITLLHGDALTMLATLADRSVQTVVTSPPYYGLRDYGTATWIGGSLDCDHRESSESRTAKSKASSGLDGGKGSIHMSHMYRDLCGKCGAKRDDRQIGQEAAPDCLAWARGMPPCGACYVCALRAVFAALWRVLRDDGTCWLNLGDSYAAQGGGKKAGKYAGLGHVNADYTDGACDERARTPPPGLQAKDLIMIPARVALALQADGWIVRNDNIWSKPNPMPESVTDRCTRAHEYVFLLSKMPRYFYDAQAIAEDAQGAAGNARSFRGGGVYTKGQSFHNSTPAERETHGNVPNESGTRNRRTVWSIATQPFAGAHFATMPEALIEPCILAGSKAGDTVLDPFAGSGTVLRVAERFQRNAIGIDLNADYIDLQEKRTDKVQVEMFV